MSDEEVHRLLAGYATDTLSPLERTALFQAAMADQKVFDALQEEEALRDLLSDPLSRREIQRALEPRSRSGWAWGGLVAGLAAAGLTVMVWTRGPGMAPQQPVEIATLKPALKPEGTPERAVGSAPTAGLRATAPLIAVAKQPEAVADQGEMAAKPVVPTISAPAPATLARRAESPTASPAMVVRSAAGVADQAPAAGLSEAQTLGASRKKAGAVAQSADVHSQSAGSVAQSQSVGGPRQQAGERGVFGGFAASKARAESQTLAFTLVRNGSPLGGTDLPRLGDAVQASVPAPIAGTLTLFRRDAAGNWVPVSERLAVESGRTYLLPEQPMKVGAVDVYRLVLQPAEGPPRQAEFTLSAK